MAMGVDGARNDCFCTGPKPWFPLPSSTSPLHPSHPRRTSHPGRRRGGQRNAVANRKDVGMPYHKVSLLRLDGLDATVMSPLHTPIFV